MEVVVAEFANELDAEVARSQLESEGIESAIIKDDAGSMLPSLQATEGVQLLVAAEDEENARRILEQSRP
jgi:hypothetical protein